MRWIVEIASVADEHALRRILAHAGAQVVSTANVTCGLWSPAFEAYTALDQVCAHVTHVPERLRRFAELTDGPHVGLVLGDVFEALPDGSYKR